MCWQVFDRQYKKEHQGHFHESKTERIDEVGSEDGSKSESDQEILLKNHLPNMSDKSLSNSSDSSDNS